MNSNLKIRSAVEADIPSLLRIYNHYITSSHFTFDTTATSGEEWRVWFDDFAPSGPHRLVVAVEDSELIGYASSKPFRSKAAYRTSVETSIYLDPAFTGQGIGKMLYRDLLDSLERQNGFHRAYAGIALPNPISVALHERLNYKIIGTFHEVGYKFGQYWDVSWYERDLQVKNKQMESHKHD